MGKETSCMNGRLLKIHTYSSRYIVTHFFPSGFYIHSREDEEFSTGNKWGCAKAQCHFFVCGAIGMNVSAIHENYGHDPHYNHRERAEEKGEKKRRRTMQRNLGKSAARLCPDQKSLWSGGEKWWSRWVAIFRHSFIPYGTEIYTAHGSRAGAAGNKTRKSSLKKKEARRGEDEGCAHVAETRDTLVWCTTSGLLLRNKPSSLSFSL